MPRAGHAGAVSELKRPGAPPSSITESQHEWIERLRVCGFLVDVHYGWEAAAKFFDDYVKLETVSYDSGHPDVAAIASRLRST